MHQRYSDRQLYFNEQVYTTRKYVIPFIERHKPVEAGLSVLEIGCGEGGNMQPFLDRNCRVTGIDIVQDQIDVARRIYASHPNVGNLTLICEDIYNVSRPLGPFDLIIMRDVIEHIPDQSRLMVFIKRFLAPGGMVFIGFPPWQNPFGGHQQVSGHVLLSRTPWIHLLPRSLYAKIWRCAGMDPSYFLDLKQTGLSLERFFSIIRKETNYEVAQEVLWLFNPNYEVKFHLPPCRIWKVFNIPYIRNLYTTCGYWLLKNKD